MAGQTKSTVQFTVGAASVLVAGACRMAIRRRIESGGSIPPLTLEFVPGLAGLGAAVLVAALWDRFGSN